MLMNEEQEIYNEFLELLQPHRKRKIEEHFDGPNVSMSLDHALRLAIEELGEVASAITRNRFVLAKHECIDLAQCAYLIYVALKRQEVDNDQPENP